MTAQDALMQKYPMIDDLIPLAHRRIPTYAIDYLEHGSGRERLLVRNREAFDDIQITPRYMRARPFKDVVWPDLRLADRYRAYWDGQPDLARG